MDRTEPATKLVVYLPIHVRAEFERTAQRRGLNRQAAVRQAIAQWTDQQANKEEPR